MAAPAGQANVVCYHYPCPDGVWGACCAATKLGTEGTRFVPLETTVPPASRVTDLVPTFTEDQTVFLVDYVVSSEFILACCKKVAKVVLLDHHKTALESLAEIDAGAGRPENLEVHIDMEKSGATIAYDFFSEWEGPKLACTSADADVDASEAKAQDGDLEEEFRVHVRHIEDRDLWRKALDTCDEYFLGTSALKLEFSYLKNPGIFEELRALRAADLIASGTKLKAEIEATVEKAVEKAVEIRIPLPDGAGHAVGLAVYGDETVQGLRSDVGNKLAIMAHERGLSPLGVVGSATEDGGVKLSLRSLSSEPFDTTTLSKPLGGGGHRCASGCVVPKDEFRAWTSLDKL